MTPVNSNNPKKAPVSNTASIYEGGPPGGSQSIAREVFRGEIMKGDEDKIKAGLIEGQYFVPAVAGLSPAREGLHRMPHRFIRLEATKDRNTDPRRISEVVKSLANMKTEIGNFQKATTRTKTVMKF